MLIISQNKDKITENLNFSIIGIKTCENIFIDEKDIKKYEKITQKKHENVFNITELKGLGELVGKDLTRYVYTIIEKNRLENFGTFLSKEQAQKVLQDIIKKYEKGDKKYQIPKDKNVEITLI